MRDEGDPGAERLAERARERAEKVRARARGAHEQLTSARERGEQLAQCLGEWRSGCASPSESVDRAADAAREATAAAERTEQLAVQGYEHAAQGLERAAHAHAQLADHLERRAETASVEQADELLERADEHSAQGAADQEEADVDQHIVHDLRE